MLIFLTDIKKEELNQELLVKLEQASTAAGIDFTVTSGYRPGVDGVDHGIKSGPHMHRKAVDLRCHDSVTRFKIRYGLIKAGFKRIGQNSIHIHADTLTLAEGFPENVDWIEPEPS
jgi:zinc D-Ala-D-Ala carboxypeptidase